MAEKRTGKVHRPRVSLPKCPTGIHGFDEITRGGLPLGRPTLVVGAAGCGKTLFSVEFLVRGVLDYGDPGVFMSFEENRQELERNVLSLGFNLAELEARKKIHIDHVQVERSEIEETGEYDLEGLFIRLGHGIDSIGAKRVVLDTIESLFGGLTNQAILRSELRRLFRWLKEKGVTTVITGERGKEELTRHGLEEYVADCVILLDHRVTEQLSTRRIRVVKYRGSPHQTNEFPFLIGDDGIFLVPITSMGLDYSVSPGRISSGIPRLDAMLGGKGFYRGSSILITGTPGTGKTSMAASFAEAACRRGEKCLFFAFEETRAQIFRNMQSIGIDLAEWERKGLLNVHADRPTAAGLETHLLTLHRMTRDHNPKVIVIDPISNLTEAGIATDVKGMLSRLIDFYKSKGITTCFTNLLARGEEATSGMGISSLMDSWLGLETIETGGEFNRGLYILKSRGMAHSNQVREFRLTDRGVELLDVPVSSGEVLMGSARVAMEAREREEERDRLATVARRTRLFEQKKREKEAKVTSIETEFLAEEEELNAYLNAEDRRRNGFERARREMSRSRKADRVSAGPGTRETRTGRGKQ